MAHLRCKQDFQVIVLTSAIARILATCVLIVVIEICNEETKVNFSSHKFNSVNKYFLYLFE